MTTLAAAASPQPGNQPAPSPVPRNVAIVQSMTEAVAGMGRSGLQALVESYPAPAVDVEAIKRARHLELVTGKRRPRLYGGGDPT